MEEEESVEAMRARWAQQRAEAAAAQAKRKAELEAAEAARFAALPPEGQAFERAYPPDTDRALGNQAVAWARETAPSDADLEQGYAAYEADPTLRSRDWQSMTEEEASLRMKHYLYLLQQANRASERLREAAEAEEVARFEARQEERRARRAAREVLPDEPAAKRVQVQEPEEEGGYVPGAFWNYGRQETAQELASQFSNPVNLLPPEWGGSNKRYWKK